MDKDTAKSYSESQRSGMRALFETHACAWRPFLAGAYGESVAETIIRDARLKHEALIAALPYIGGDGNPMTRHLVRSTTSLALYQAMAALGRSPAEAGKIVYDAVTESVRGLPPTRPPTAAELAEKRAQARWSQERRYPADWVWAFVEGDGVNFDYGYDFVECATFNLYHAHGAGAFLPFYCYLDFITERTPGWGVSRAMTLSLGDDRCAFRYKKGGRTEKGWPPPFLAAGT